VVIGPFNYEGFINTKFGIGQTKRWLNGNNALFELILGNY
jgi:hypothetical protein